jgi:hypothetical protein
LAGEAGKMLFHPPIWESLMKTIASALIALSIFTGLAAPANAAWDTQAFWEGLARSAQ